MIWMQLGEKESGLGSRANEKLRLDREAVYYLIQSPLL